MGIVNTFYVGAHLRTGSTAVQQTFRLKQLFKHEQFSMRHLRNDIALLQLERPISASAKVNTVCLPSSGSRIPAGSQCYITGTPVRKWLWLEYLKIRLDTRCILHNAILLSAILYLCEFIGQIFEKIREIRVIRVEKGKELNTCRV